MGKRLGTYMGKGSLPLQVEHVSLASTRVTLTDDQQGKLLVLDGTTGSTVEIALPAPEAGMTYTLYFSTGGVSVNTKILSTAYDIDIDGTTAKGFICRCGTTDEDGCVAVLIGKNDYRWLAFGGNPYTTIIAASSGT